jgi:hypothetical protein
MKIYPKIFRPKKSFVKSIPGQVEADPSAGQRIGDRFVAARQRTDGGPHDFGHEVVWKKVKAVAVNRGRCYDHNFLRFLPIFRRTKLAFFSKTNVTIIFFQKLAVVRAKNSNIFPKCFGENIFKNYNIQSVAHSVEEVVLSRFSFWV